MWPEQSVTHDHCLEAFTYIFISVYLLGVLFVVCFEDMVSCVTVQVVLELPLQTRLASNLTEIHPSLLPEC